MEEVFILIVNWNGVRDTVNCLKSLRKLTVKAKVIVVDNGSTDESVSEIRRKFPEVTLLENKKNLGFTGGNNLGIAYAMSQHASYVWLLNNDTLIEKNSLKNLLDSFKDSKVGIAGSKIYFAPGHEYYQERYKKEDLGRVLWYAGGRIDWDNMYASHGGVNEVDNGQYDKSEETPFVTGCSMLIKASVFHSIGMFDNRYYLYLEDLDFCLRAQRIGFNTVYIPDSKIWHVNAGSSGGPGSKLHQYYLTRNRLLLGFRFAPLRTKIALFREAFLFLLKGSTVQKKAVMDFFLRKFGEQQYES